MKRRVGRYKNTILVEGDKNEFKPHEKSIDNILGGGMESSDIIRYYKTEDTDFFSKFEGKPILWNVFGLVTYKTSAHTAILSNTVSMYSNLQNDSNTPYVYAFSFIPILAPDIYTFQKMLEEYNMKLEAEFIEITKDEFINIRPY